LQDADPDLARTAAAALERLGAAARDAVPLLVQTAESRVAPDVRIAALRVLAAVGSPAAEPAVPVLSAALADPDDRIRREAAMGLGRLGPGARSAVEALCRARTDPSLSVQQAAGDAVLRIVQPATDPDGGRVEVNVPSPEKR
jgi:HEAT repeat protein